VSSGIGKIFQKASDTIRRRRLEFPMGIGHSVIMANESVPPNGYLSKQHYAGLKNNQRLWRSDDGDYFTWDRLHGEIEWYTKNGYHKGVLDAMTGALIGPAIKGRKIDVS
jgi:hypothetical protein